MNLEASAAARQTCAGSMAWPLVQPAPTKPSWPAQHCCTRSRHCTARTPGLGRGLCTPALLGPRQPADCCTRGQGDAEDAQDGGQPSLASTASPLDVHAPHHASSDPAESRGGETGGTEGGPGEASSLLGHGRRGGSKRRGAHRSHAHACSSSSSSLPAGATPQSDATAAPGDVSVDVEAGSAFSSPLQGAAVAACIARQVKAWLPHSEPGRGCGPRLQ